jgi:hypothetical protein
MTRTKLASLVLSLSAMLALAGCGGGGLLASGDATVTDTASTRSGFHFDSAVRLDGGAGTTTGTCQISRGASGVYGVVIDLYGDAQGVGHAVRSMTIMAHSEAPATGQITADLGGDEFTSSACTIDISDLDPGRGDVTLSANGCTLTHGTETATANVALTLAGCEVI